MTVQLIHVHTRTLPVVYNRIHSLDVSVSHVFIGHADHELPLHIFHEMMLVCIKCKLKQ